MRNISKIIKKNFKLLLRSKSSALIVILGPLLVIFLLGLAFNNAGTYSIKIGVYSGEYSDLTNSFIEKLEENEGFSVRRFNSEEDCVEKVKDAKMNTCIIFPEGMELSGSNTNEVTFHVDHSKINLVWMILDTLSTELGERSSELSTELTNVLLDRLSNTREEMVEEKTVIEDLKLKGDEINSKVDKIGFELNSLDLNLYLSDKEIQEIIKVKEESKERLNSFKSDIESRINESKISLLDVKEDLERGNKSGRIVNIIEDTITTMNTIKLRTKNITNYTDSKWEEVRILIGKVQQNLADVNERIGEVKTVRDNVNDDINFTKTKIEESIESMNGVNSFFDAIIQNIESVKVKDAATIVNPITTNIKPIVPEKTHLNYAFPSLLILVIMFVSILLSTTLVMMERHSPAYFRNIITPTKGVVFVLATYFTNVILVGLQVIIIMAISIFVLKIHIPWINMLYGGGLLFLVTSMFTFIGMFIGFVFTSEETATLASISVGSALFLLSDLILPLESMPRYISKIAGYNPFVISENLLKKIMFFEPTFWGMINEVLILVAVVMVLFVVVGFLEDISKKHLMYGAFHKKEKK